VTVLAHRGGAGPWRENTVEAFAGALRLGADGVELDVRRCRDGALVVLHDPDVPGIGPVHERTVDELPPWVPGLGRALEACRGAAVNVEIKNGPNEAGFDPDQAVARDVAALLAEMAPAGRRPPAAGGSPAPADVPAHAPADVPADVPAHLIVSCFFPATLAAVGDVWPDAPLGLLVHPALDADEALDVAVGLGCAALHPHVSQVTPDLVARSHDRGTAVVTWTVDEPAELAAVADAGVDAVITDHVGRALGALGRVR